MWWDIFASGRGKVKKPKIRHYLAFLLIFICISPYATLFAADHFSYISRKLIPHIIWILIFATLLLLWDKMELFIKKQIVLKGDRRKKYKQTIRLIKRSLEKFQTSDADRGVINEIDKRKIGLRAIYSCFNIDEKRFYEEYKGYYKKVEEHFCFSDYTNCELLVLDLKYIVDEYEKCKYISSQVCNKIMGLCEEIIHSNLILNERMKIECITCLEKLSNYLQGTYLDNDLPKLKEQIEDTLIKLGKDRINFNLSKKLCKYKPCGDNENMPKSDLEFYAWYSPYMAFRKTDLTCVQLIKYFRKLDFYYDKTRKAILSENGLNTELHLNEMLYIIEASQLYEELVYDDISEEDHEEVIEIVSDIFEVLTKVVLKI